MFLFSTDHAFIFTKKIEQSVPDKSTSEEIAHHGSMFDMASAEGFHSRRIQFFLVHRRFFLLILTLTNSLKFPFTKHLRVFSPWEFIYHLKSLKQVVQIVPCQQKHWKVLFNNCCYVWSITDF